MLYLTTYAAFVVYDVVGAVPAAAAVVIVTVGAGVLSVLQDSRPLAVLGIIGGFLAPVLTYSRPDDHVYVFQLLPGAERGDPRGRLVQDVARS